MKQSMSQKLAPLDGPVKKFTKKELVEACRKQAPAFDSTFLLLRRKMKAQKDIQPGVRADDPDVGSQVKVMDSGVKMNAKKYNEYQLVADRLQAEYNKKLDKLTDLKRNDVALDQMINCTNPESKRIQELIKEIEKVNTQTDRKLHYRLQLNHMYSRLQKNSVTLDAHLNAMEDTYNGAEKEFMHCESLMREVQAGRTKALRELEGTIEAVTVQRTDRDRTLSSKQNEAQNASKMEEWRNSTEKSRQELAQSLKGDMNREEEEQLVATMYAYKNKREQQHGEIEQRLKILHKMEEAFKHIKDATGVNTLTEMVDKFSNHREHRDRLLIEKKDAEERLTGAKSNLEECQSNFNKSKEVGFGDTELNREILNTIEADMLNERIEGKGVKATCERLEGVLVGLRQGGMGLYQRLLAYTSLLDGEVPQLNESATTSAIEAAYDTLKMLNVTEHILGKMLDTIGSGDGSPARFSVLPNDEDSNSLEDGTVMSNSVSNETVETLENPNLGEANCRITSVKAESSTQMFSKGDDEGLDRGFDDLEIDDSAAVENIVPSRQFLKMSSGRQAGEARRQAEMEQRRVKMQERLAAADEKERAALTSSAALQKQQTEANARLAKHHHPVGLPKSLTVRDDPMTKAQVFMTQIPQLD